MKKNENKNNQKNDDDENNGGEFYSPLFNSLDYMEMSKEDIEELVQNEYFNKLIIYRNSKIFVNRMIELINNNDDRIGKIEKEIKKQEKKGGWNGGGSGGCATSAGGGGSTNISLNGKEGSSEWNNADHLYSRIIVAGGGGGAGTRKNVYGGYGGGEKSQCSVYGPSDNEGTQTRAGTNKSFSSGQGFGIGGYHTVSSSGGQVMFIVCLHHQIARLDAS